MKVFRYSGLFMPPRGEPLGPPPEPESAWKVIHSASAASQDAATISLTMDTRGSNCIIISVGMLATSPSIADSEGNTHYVTYAREDSGSLSIRFLVCLHPITAENHNFYLYGFGTTYMACNILAVHAPDPQVRLTAIGLSLGTQVSPDPIEVPFSHALAISGWSGNVFGEAPTGPDGYEVYGAAIGRPGLNFPMYSAKKLFNGPSLEQPSWKISTPAVQSANLIVLSGSDAVPFVLKSTAYMESATSSVTVTLDTRDATLIVLCAGGFFGDVATATTPYPAITVTSSPYFMLGTPNNPYIGMRFLSFLNPSITSANHQFTVAMNRPDSPNPSTPSIRAFVFRSTGTVSRETIGGNAVANATSIQSTTAANINFPNALLMTAAMTNVSGSPFVSPAGFEIFFQASSRYPMAVGIRFPFSPSTENPIWQTTASGQLSTSLISFKSS